jgi:coniferyl-aldehyde dehydrogenase
MMELIGIAHGIDYHDRSLRRFMRPTRRQIAVHMRSGHIASSSQPRGVVGVISPSNYPVNLPLMPVVSAIAAGNHVMFKPSGYTPATNAVLAAMLGALLLGERVAIVRGDGPAFSSQQFDHLVSTGSTVVGRAVIACRSKFRSSP